MKVLFVTPDFALSPDGYGGASALAYSHLELLAHSGQRLVLAILDGWGGMSEFDRYMVEQPDVWKHVQGWIDGWERLAEDAASAGHGPHRLRTLRDPVAASCARVGPVMAAAFQALVDRVQPDLIWAEHRKAAIVALCFGQEVPVVYGHHDWGWKLHALHTNGRDLEWRVRYRIRQKRRAEEHLVRKVAGCVSGSATERATMQRLGAVHTGYFPTTGTPVDLAARAAESPRLVHLSTMQATASREGMQRFLDVVWPQLDPPPALWLVGSMAGAPEGLRQRLHEIGARCTGYVKDLRTVLRPYDLHIIPWEHDTGTRTRATIALNHAQVLVATQASMACLPELRAGENSMLVARLEDMAGVIHSLLDDSIRRRRLGDAARGTFLEAFTREAQQPRFDVFLRAFGSLPRSVRHPASYPTEL